MKEAFLVLQVPCVLSLTAVLIVLSLCKKEAALHYSTVTRGTLPIASELPREMCEAFHVISILCDSATE